MSGTKAGALKGRDMCLARDPDYYVKLGQVGGKLSKGGGFAAGDAGRERARVYGRIGGRISRRRKRASKANSE